MVSREFREMLSRIKMPVKKRYFEAAHQTLFYDEERGLWVDCFGMIPKVNNHVSSIQELVNFCK